MSTAGAGSEMAPRAATERNSLLLAGGCFSLAFAVFQVSAMFWPAGAIRYFGGPAELSQARPAVYASICVVVAVMVAVCGLYALSGAGLFRRLPLTRTVLGVTTGVYLLRGLLLVPQLPIVIRHPEFIRFAAFSAISLCVGVVHLGGWVRLVRRGRAGGVGS
jgi:hypothetical protein